MIAFYVQGGGLGHLSRTHKLIQYLKIDAKDVLIISPSNFHRYFKQYQFITISWQATPEEWSNRLIRELKVNAIQKCYIDTFPFGLKGELTAVYKALPEISFILNCRILQWKKYVSAISREFTPNFSQAIVLERLHNDHYTWIKTVSRKVDQIQLPTTTPKKHIKLANVPYGIIIQSGNKDDVINICQKVKTDTHKSPIDIFVFTQVLATFEDEQFHFRIQEFPVHQYFKHASKIYSAAGFNLMNELAPYQEKHTIFPLERLYDDQFFRAQNSASLFLK
ncbi:MAG: hypothetical protein AB8B59_15465 [Maribacter sp.]